MDEVNRAKGNAFELILSVCAGLRKVVPITKDEVVYNDALGDVFDFIIENETNYLMPETVRSGKWERDCYEDIKNKYVGKWVAFRQEGMPMVLHGKVVRLNHGIFTIKCKNGERRYGNMNDIIGFYDSKDECYLVKN